MKWHIDVLDASLPLFGPVANDVEARRRLAELAEHFGLLHASYLSVENRFADDVRIRFFTTYPESWIRRYLDRGYQNIDPVIGLTRHRLLPLDWNSISIETGLVRDFFGEAREFGVGQQGLSIPVRGPLHEAALFTVTLDCPNSEWGELKRDLLPYLQVAAYEFHKMICEMGQQPRTVRDVTLSRRETECLKWASAGKTVWETSQILDISERTVKFHLMGAVQRLCCANKIQAVSTAIRMKLI